MKKIVFLTLSFLLISLHSISQTETSNNEKINLQSPSSVSLFQSNSSNGVWATGTITADRFGIFEDATSTKERLTILPGGNIGIGTTNPANILNIEKNQNGSTLLEINNNNSGNSARRGIIIGEGTPGKSVYLLSTSSNYNQVNTWANAGVLGTDSQLSNGLIMRSASGKIRFQPNGISDKIVFDENGNVGIGATSPSGKLEVLKNADLSNDISLPNSALVLRADNNGNDASLRFGVDNTNLKAVIQTQQTTTAAKFDLLLNPFGGKIGIGTTNPTQKLQVDAKDSAIQIQLNRTGSNTGTVDFGVDNNGLHYWVGGYDGFGKEEFLIGTNGNIGIGTTTPQEKLEVKGKMFLNSGLNDDGIYWARHNMTMGTIPGSYNHNVFMLKPGGSSNGFLYSKFEMYTANSETDKTKKVQIHSYGTSFFNGGNVGIGTNTPDAKLAVNGNIHTQEVKVDLVGWPDYVFEDDYNLPTLQQVENHITEKGHLENIPSAAEVSENGIELGEMNKKLLQKIEELTLYMIEQDKVNQQQQKQMKELKNAIEELKK
ncbi:hypothetical protein [Aquimarina latercula]|uniref:hypothetical protein n=1 Tax=Aquimarina latercula TaxID=987 RepID=UPI00040C3ED2|nr:hypothetical protein [Aquimarina latercula]